ncbi:hypothetical protein [Croceimicrobium sp.]|uniref:hypothetical protein n=1 Tax=Croceimicrobium sp. TaxID=2828340 RepID=UPI003BAD1CC9
MKIPFLFFIGLYAFGLSAQDLAPESPNLRQDPLWFKYNRSYGFLSTSLDVDEKGNIYTGGTFQTTLDCLDTVYEMPRRPFRETFANFPFVQKFSEKGDLLWTVRVSGQARLHDLKVDAESSVYICGEVWSSDLVFMSTNGQLDSIKIDPKLYRGLYLAKLDSNGVFQQATFYGKLPHSNASAMALTEEGEVVLAGNYMYREQNEIIRNWLLMKYDANFQQKWLRAGDSAGRSNLITIALDGWGHIYAGGSYAEHLKIEEKEYNLRHETHKAFVAKWNEEGELKWLNGAITDTADQHGQTVVNELRVDWWHRIYFAGSIFSRLAVGKLQRDGDLAWYHRSAGRSSYPFGMEWKDQKNLLLYGHGYGGTFSSRKGATEISYQVKGSTDFFVIEESKRGELKRALVGGAEGTDYATALFWRKGKLYLLGHDLGGPDVVFQTQSIESNRPVMWLACWDWE